MDLREKKTKKNIRNAFLTLRAKKELERITVKELAELAEISKATFYLHYKDIYDLSDVLQKEVIQGILTGISRPEDVWEDTGRFVRELTEIFYAQRNIIQLLFSGSQSHVLSQSIEAAIREYIFRLRPELLEDTAFSIGLTYQIYGCFYAYKEHCDRFGLEPVLDVMSRMSATSRFAREN